MAHKKATERTMAAGAFKAQCLRVMDEVARTRRAIVITKRGRAVAKLVPADTADPGALFGRLAGQIHIAGEIMAPLDPPEAWDPVAEFDEVSRENPPR
jgi:prevent-host-death family protein